MSGFMLPIPLFKAKGIKPSELVKNYRSIVKSGQFANFGPFYQKSIKALEDLYPNKSFVICNNGTTSLTTILKATFAPQSRIGVPSFTFIATVSAVLDAHMVPVILPCHTGTWSLDLSILEANSSRIDGFIVVNPFGYKDDYSAYDAASEALSIPVVYDAAAGFGQSFDTNSPVSVSLHATKNLPIGEGGLIILEKHTDLTDKCKALINFGMDESKTIQYEGTNGKLDELHCSILLTQLEDIPKLRRELDRTRNLISDYIRDLPDYGLTAISAASTPQLPIFHVGRHIDKLERLANRHWITTRRYYYPLMNKTFYGYAIPSLDYKNEYFENFLALPKNVTKDEYSYIIESLNKPL